MSLEKLRELYEIIDDPAASDFRKGFALGAAQTAQILTGSFDAMFSRAQHAMADPGVESWDSVMAIMENAEALKAQMKRAESRKARLEQD